MVFSQSVLHFQLPMSFVFPFSEVLGLVFFYGLGRGITYVSC